MKTAAYEALAKKEAKSLEQVVGHSVGHGNEGTCPNCGHIGLYDMKGLGLSAASIYFSAADDKWQCMACEMDSLGF